VTVTPEDLDLSLVGSVTLLAKASGHSRPMGGWLTTFGQVDGSGAVVPTVDREQQVMEAAKTGAIDWTPYIQGGVWNDEHSPTVVGLPSSLTYHGPASDMAKAHGKVGFYTTGRLFDRADPSSWRGLTNAKGEPRAPQEAEFAAADRFWAMAKALDGSPRSLGLSAEGKARLSPCRRRILACRISAAAVCATPMNPDATLEIMAKAVRLSTADPNPCLRCACPAGACAVAFRSVMTPDEELAKAGKMAKPGDTSTAPPPAAEDKPEEPDEEEEGDEDTEDEDSKDEESADGSKPVVGGFRDVQAMAKDMGDRMQKGEAIDAAEFMLSFATAIEGNLKRAVRKAVKPLQEELAKAQKAVADLSAQTTALQKGVDESNATLAKALSTPTAHSRANNTNAVLASIVAAPSTASEPRIPEERLTKAVFNKVATQTQINMYRTKGVFDLDPTTHEAIKAKVSA
jgi:hypothetical protein